MATQFIQKGCHRLTRRPVADPLHNPDHWLQVRLAQGPHHRTVWRRTHRRMRHKMRESAVGIVEAPPYHARPRLAADVMVQPVPGQRALAETAERPHDEHRGGLRREPRIEVGEFGGAPSEVGQVGVGVGEEPGVRLRGSVRLAAYSVSRWRDFRPTSRSTVRCTVASAVL